jgi:hypothetical protein
VRDLAVQAHNYVSSGGKITRGSFAEIETIGMGDTYTAKP